MRVESEVLRAPSSYGWLYACECHDERALTTPRTMREARSKCDDLGVNSCHGITCAHECEVCHILNDRWRPCANLTCGARLTFDECVLSVDGRLGEYNSSALVVAGVASVLGVFLLLAATVARIVASVGAWDEPMSEKLRQDAPHIAASRPSAPPPQARLAENDPQRRVRVIDATTRNNGRARGQGGL